MKYNLKTAASTYIIWCFLAYFTASFYVWDFNPGHWPQEHRDVMTMFGPIFGVFIFLSVLFWDEAIKESNLENE